MLDKHTYIPKGGMCMSCRYRQLDCSGLDFYKMKVIQVWNNLKIVKCERHLALDKRT